MPVATVLLVLLAPVICLASGMALLPRGSTLLENHAQLCFVIFESVALAQVIPWLGPSSRALATTILLLPAFATLAGLVDRSSAAPTCAYSGLLIVGTTILWIVSRRLCARRARCIAAAVMGSGAATTFALLYLLRDF